MKKVIITILIVLIILIGGLYCLLFTPFGNNIVKGILESRLNSKIPVKVKVQDFKLTMSHFYIKIFVKNNSFIKASGDYSIFSKSIDGKYEIKLIDLAKFEKLLNYKLNGNLYTKGKCKGSQEKLTISGIADFAHSKLDYDITLKNSEITDLLINSKGIKIGELLYFLNLPQYADGLIDINGKITNLKNGKIDIKIYNGVAFAKILNKEFALKLTKNINFRGFLENRLGDNKLLINGKILTSLANLDLPSLKLDLKDFSLDGKYILKIDDLGKLYDFTQTKLRGHLILDGKLSKDGNLIKTQGIAKVASSNLNYNVTIENSKVKELIFNTKKMKIGSLLYMLYFPHYAEGFIDLDGSIKNLKKGKVDVKIYNGLVIAKVVNKEFNQKLKKNITFSAIINNILNDDIVNINAKVKTSLADLSLPDLKFNIKKNILGGTYTLNIPDLKKLYDITQTKLRGKVLLKGKIAKIKDTFNADGNANLFNGNVNFVLKNNLFNLQLKNIKTNKVMYMLYYPEMFDSSGGGNLNYHILKKIGDFNFKFTNGRLIKRNLTFIPRTVVDLVKVFTGVDLTKELYKVINLNGRIVQNVIVANLYLKSRLAEISSNKAVIDLNREKIKALVNINVNGTKFPILIKGNLKRPKIKLKSGKAILSNPKVQKQKKKLEKNIRKKLENLFH